MILKFRSDDDDRLTVIVEPWAEEFLISIDEILELELVGEFSPVNISHGTNYVTVSANAGCTVTVFKNGLDITPKSMSLPSPFNFKN